MNEKQINKKYENEVSRFADLLIEMESALMELPAPASGCVKLESLEKIERANWLMEMAIKTMAK
tara:strand:+ start:352 stop:543 length:192 start_codon:yes stop_codon:yes gene_type:complete